MIAFIGWELRTDTPLLDVRLFKLAGFSTGSVSIFLQFVAAFGFFFTASQFLAFTFDYSPLWIGLGLLPIGATIPLGSAIAPKLIARFGRGPVGGVGLATLAAGATLFSFVGVDSAYWFFAIGVLVFGLGFGLAAPPATEAIVEALPANKQGVASAINDVTRELGAAFGIAIVGSMLTAGYRSTVESSDLPEQLVEPIADSAGVPASRSPASRLRAAISNSPARSSPRFATASPTASDGRCSSPQQSRSSGPCTSQSERLEARARSQRTAWNTPRPLHEPGPTRHASDLDARCPPPRKWWSGRWCWACGTPWRSSLHRGVVTVCGTRGSCPSRSAVTRSTSSPGRSPTTSRRPAALDTPNWARLPSPFQPVDLRRRYRRGSRRGGSPTEGKAAASALAIRDARSTSPAALKWMPSASYHSSWASLRQS